MTGEEEFGCSTGDGQEAGFLGGSRGGCRLQGWREELCFGDRIWNAGWRAAVGPCPHQTAAISVPAKRGEWAGPGSLQASRHTPLSNYSQKTPSPRMTIPHSSCSGAVDSVVTAPPFPSPPSTALLRPASSCCPGEFPLSALKKGLDLKDHIPLLPEPGHRTPEPVWGTLPSFPARGLAARS